MEFMNGNEIMQEIKAKLSQIEQQKNIRILYACESGSRAWGFASTDCKAETFYSACKTAESRPKNEVYLDQTYSDYDVRFIYVRPKEFYLKLENTRDTLECELNELYDISGWDLKKMLRLLNRSNPSIFEWAASPIVYRTTVEWDFIKQILNKLKA